MSDVREKWIKVPGRLTSATEEGKLIGADEIIDDALGESQAALNQYFMQGGGLEDGSVTHPKLAPAAVYANNIQDGEITEGKIAGNAVTSAKIADSAVTEEKIRQGAVTSSTLAEGAVVAGKLGIGAVGGNNIAGNAITTDKIKNAAIETGKIKNFAVETEKIADGAIKTAKIDDEQITTPKIADRAIEEGKLKDGAVSKNKLSLVLQERIDDTYIKDEVYNQSQTYNKTEVYNKDEIGSIISNTAETTAVVLDVQQGETAADALDAVANADRPNKLFRVRNDDNTAYSEYGWNGDNAGNGNFVLLAEKDYGIDDEPVEDSSNIISSDAVAKFIKNTTSNATKNGVQFALTDKDGNIIYRVDSDNKLKMMLDVVASTVNGVPQAVTAENTGTHSDDFKWVWIDEDGNILFGITNDNRLVSGIIDVSKLYYIIDNH